MTDEEALRLPKGHPARFLHFYGSKPFDMEARLRERRLDPDFMQRVERTMDENQEALRMLDYGVMDDPDFRPGRRRRPFADDIAACNETNS